MTIATVLTKFEPHWESVPVHFNYYAIDGDGAAWYFETKPKTGVYRDEWLRGGTQLYHKTHDAEPVDWTQTLVARPGAKP